MATKFDVRRAYPSEVGWVAHLYRSPDTDELRAQWLEQKVFQRIDDRAAKVLAFMNSAQPQTLSAEQLSHWTLFIRSLFHRTPENLRQTKAAANRLEVHIMTSIKAQYADYRGPNDPLTYEEYEASVDDAERERTALLMLPDMIMNRRIGTFIINMRWRVFDLDASCPRLLLSDDPLARTNGIGVKGGHLAMPLSPHRILVMAESDDTMAEIAAIPLRDLTRTMNTWTVEGSRHFVVALDRTQDRFVMNRFGRNPKASITANLGKLDEIATSRPWLPRSRRLGAIRQDDQR